MCCLLLVYVVAMPLWTSYVCIIYKRNEQPTWKTLLLFPIIYLKKNNHQKNMILHLFFMITAWGTFLSHNHHSPFHTNRYLTLAQPPLPPQIPSFTVPKTKENAVPYFPQCGNGVLYDAFASHFLCLVIYNIFLYMIPITILFVHKRNVKFGSKCRKKERKFFLLCLFH